MFKHIDHWVNHLPSIIMNIKYITPSLFFNTISFKKVHSSSSESTSSNHSIHS